LADRTGLVRSDRDRSFQELGGEQQLFTALSVLVKSADAGRHHVAVFMAFWTLQHLWGLLRQPAKSPNYFFRKFRVDVYARLAVSMSAFYFRFDLPLSCLAMAEGTADIVRAGASPNPLANWWQMTAARHAVMAAYKLHEEAAFLFARNVGRISTCSLYYDDLVLTHISSQLEYAVDMLLEMYTTMAMHKRCAVVQVCWDPKRTTRQRLLTLLDRLRRTLHGRLAEPNASQRLQVNARAVLNFLPLIESSPQRLFKTSTQPASPKVEHMWSRVFVDSHCAMGNSDNDDEDILAPGDNPALLFLSLRTTFCQVVPLSGASTTLDRQNYVDFAQRFLDNPSGPVFLLLGQTWWKESRAVADRVFTFLTFFALWQGPTLVDNFWPTWPNNLIPSQNQLDAAAAGMDMEERNRQNVNVALSRLAREALRLYQETSSGRHPRRFLLDKLVHNLHASNFSTNVGGGGGGGSQNVDGVLMDAHSSNTANGMVYNHAKDFCYRQSRDRPVQSAANEMERHGQFLRHAHSRDGILLEEVLDFGRDFVRYHYTF
jgi:hypothetical protein